MDVTGERVWYVLALMRDVRPFGEAHPYPVLDRDPGRARPTDGLIIMAIHPNSDAAYADADNLSGCLPGVVVRVGGQRGNPLPVGTLM